MPSNHIFGENDSMKQSYSLLLFGLIFTFQSIAQDTTWVQTFTFDSITARRGNFEFPAELNDKRFEKVLMYYKLKCSPLTTWDSYNCGEWDYLTYTRVFDHTGQMDSVRRDSVKYLANYSSPAVYEFNPSGYTNSDTYTSMQSKMSGLSATYSSISGTMNGVSDAPFATSNKGSRMQFVISATELLAGGITPGELKSLTLDIATIVGNGEIINPMINIKSTTLTDLFSFEATGFTNVYNWNRSALNTNALIAGTNEFIFHQPFNWNGTDNLIIELTFDRPNENGTQIGFNMVDASGNGLSYPSKNGSMKFDGTDQALLQLSDFDLGDEFTICMWVKGNGSTSTNTSILEAYDTLNRRVINVHLPWSNNRMYFDAGEGSGYDRIDIDMNAGDIDNNWVHWAFVKDAVNGEMFIYRNGVQFHYGNGKNLSVGYIHRMVLGQNWNGAYKWKGNIDDFQLFDVALDATAIANNYMTKGDINHPFYSNLLVSYDFDDDEYAQDRSANNYMLMPSDYGMFDFSQYPQAGIQNVAVRPLVEFGQSLSPATFEGVFATEYAKLKEPQVVFEFAQVANHFEIVNAFLGLPSGNEVVYDENMNVVSSTPFTGAWTINNEQVTYYEAPFEIIHDVEIARYITPYGIQFDLGPQGFAWIYDVTDYQHYLKNTVDLAAHNTQELIDLKFAFIEGIPPRDVHKREPVWADFRSYNFANLANDVDLQSTSVELSDTSDMFKIKTRLSGHGQVGNGACCEWVPNNHQIKLDGVSRFNWNIWQTTECGDNPNISQGGTWPYAREGWCPGDMVRENDFDMTPYVNPGTTVDIDYAINQVPVSDPGQAGGNYIMAFDLISYGAPNHQNDAAIIDVLNPNNYEYFSKWNPTCSNPRIVLQNAGEQPLTSCIIRCWITYGDWIEYQWTGNLGFLEKEIVEIPVDDITWWQDYEGLMTFTAQVYAVEGTQDLDEYPNNNVKSVKFSAPEVINGPFFVWFTTNNRANENQWRLQDSDGNVIFERTSLLNSTQYKDTFDLVPGCYSIIIEDSDHDGISFWASAQYEGETGGSFRVRLVGGSYAEIFPGDFGHYHRYDFSVGFGVGLDEEDLDHKIAVIPNPNNGQCTIELSGSVSNDAQLEILDLSGRKIYGEKMISTSNFAESHLDLSWIPSGNYIVKIITGERVYTEKMIKQ